MSEDSPLQVSETREECKLDHALLRRQLTVVARPCPCGCGDGVVVFCAGEPATDSWTMFPPAAARQIIADLERYVVQAEAISAKARGAVQ